MTSLRYALSLASALTALAAHAQQPPGGTLAECLRAHGVAAHAAACVLDAQRAASDAMLSTFRSAQEAVLEMDRAAGSDALAAALTESQRDFERYVQGQCTFVHALFARAGIADLAATACETDLLKQRTAVLQSFARVENRN